MTEKEFIKLSNKILYIKQSALTPFGGKKSELKGLKELYKAINYTHSCKSDSELLKSKECPMCNEEKDCQGHTVCEDCGGRSF